MYFITSMPNCLDFPVAFSARLHGIYVKKFVYKGLEGVHFLCKERVLHRTIILYDAAFTPHYGVKAASATETNSVPYI